MIDALPHRTVPGYAEESRVHRQDAPRDRQYDCIGVRIEDDYMATPRDIEHITPAVREISEIEALMQPPRP